uniref:GDSL esterase/lipase n=1 Tax=Chenopodium quinoa TaxID=63459 RepID=A0A803KPN5_CHEQI
MKGSGKRQNLKFPGFEICEVMTSGAQLRCGIFRRALSVVGVVAVRVGLKNTNQPCCGVAAECVPFSPPCKDRKARAYWDQEHPTEAANKILASRDYKAKMFTDTYPMDISALAALHFH